MPEVPGWAVLLLAGVSFGFGAGGAWMALGYRIKRLEEWKREHRHVSDTGIADIQKLQRDLATIQTVTVGVTGRNGHTGELRRLRQAMHDVNNWISAASDKLDVQFHRSKRPHEEEE